MFGRCYEKAQKKISYCMKGYMWKSEHLCSASWDMWIVWLMSLNSATALPTIIWSVNSSLQGHCVFKLKKTNKQPVQTRKQTHFRFVLTFKTKVLFIYFFCVRVFNINIHLRVNRHPVHTQVDRVKSGLQVFSFLSFLWGSFKLVFD